MNLFGRRLSRSELLERVGGLLQVAGAQMISNEDGHARGVRSVDVRTGSGFRFAPVVDRGLDVGWCEYRGAPLCWMPPNGIAAPWFFEGVHDELAWARAALGGLFNTAGLLSIGPPQQLNSPQYESITLNTGTHNRIAVTPAARVNYGERWEGDRCVVWVEGTVRQHAPYGENLVLSRLYESEVGGNCFSLHDEVRNDGYFSIPHQILYHFNIGFPILSDSSEVLAPVDGDVSEFSFSSASDQGEPARRYAQITEPQEGFAHEGFVVPLKANSSGSVGVAIVNRHIRDPTAAAGIYLQYQLEQLPVFITWRMMAQGLYAYGLEPASSPFGSPDELISQQWPVMLEPGETRTYDLEFGVLPDLAAVEQFEREDMRVFPTAT